MDTLEIAYRHVTQPVVAALRESPREVDMKLSTCSTVLLGLVALCASSTAAAAQQFDIGKREYEASCATCHGRDGKGGGSFAPMLRTRMPDLTTLSKNNGGVFPISRVYNAIDGRDEIKAHGTRDMPIWGRQLSLRDAPAYDDYAYEPEALVRARILAVTEYLYRLQVK
jgi:mono/diheme cytochrome c family protein